MKYYDKPVGPIITFVFWLLCLIVICIVGISNVFAASYDALSFTAQLYDNYGPSLSSVTTSMSNMYYTGTIPTMTANTSGAAWGISSPIPLLANHTYSLSVRIEGPYGGNLVLSTYNRIGVGTSLGNAKSSYENNSNVTENYSNVIPKNMTIQFAFTPSINATYIVFPFATTYTGNNQEFRIYNVVIDDLGASGVSQSTINNSLNNQTNIINNSITSSTNTITGSISDSENNINSNIDDMEQSIVNSNKETQQVIKDQFNDCYPITNSIKSLKATSSSFIEYYLNKNIDFSKTIYLNLKSDISLGSVSIILYYASGSAFTVVNSNLSTTNSVSFSLTQEQIDLLSSSTGDYPILRFYRRSGNSLDFKTVTISNIALSNYNVDFDKYGSEICTNKLDEQNETSKGIFGKIKELFSWLTNDDDADVSGAGNVAGWLPAGPVDSIITLPLTMLQNINTSLNKTCSPLNVNLPYVNKSVEIPCLNTIFNQITGLNSFWTWVGLIASVMILFRYLVNLYNYFDKLTDLQAQYLSDWGGV